MNKFKILAAVFLAVSLFNMLNVLLKGSGVSLILGVFWLAASAYVYMQYRKMKMKNEEKPQEQAQEAIEK